MNENSLCSLLLQSSSPQQNPQLQTLLSAPANQEYVSSLLNLPLSSIFALPGQLASLTSSLDTDLSSLAFTRYPSFLLAHTAAQTIHNSFDELSESLCQVLDSTAALGTKVNEFESRVSTVREKRERMSRVRERIEEVEQVIEAPDVVNASVRAGYWSEALDVAGRIDQLYKRLESSAESQDCGGALFLVRNVRDNISVALAGLRVRVLESLLQKGLKLPAAVRAIDTLRRMEKEKSQSSSKCGSAVRENALRVIFLTARFKFLSLELEAIQTHMSSSGVNLTSRDTTSTESFPNPKANEDVSVEENEERTRWVKKWIEVWREVVGETMSMYVEIFLGPEYAKDEENLDDLSPCTPLSLFASTALSSFRNTLAAALSCISSPTSLASLHTQIAYCSLSFSKYGLDFRAFYRLSELIESRVGQVVEREFVNAGRVWEKEWRDGWEAGLGRRGKEKKGFSCWIAIDEGADKVLSLALPDASDEAESWHHQPPAYLSLLPPLARFINAQATILNSLRLFPAQSLFTRVQKAQAKELNRAAQVLGAFIDALLADEGRKTTLNGDKTEQELSPEQLLNEQQKKIDRELVVVAVKAFGRVVLPWCEGALRLSVFAGPDKQPVHPIIQNARQSVESLVDRLS